jgi:hypothetical protein
MDKGFDIPWVWVQNIMGRRVKIPWVGRIKIPWVGGSKLICSHHNIHVAEKLLTWH